MLLPKLWGYEFPASLADVRELAVYDIEAYIKVGEAKRKAEEEELAKAKAKNS